MNSIIKAHTIKFSSRTLWTDSSTTLNWLNSDARRYKPFVALRISECLESTDAREWRYVPSKLNVVDEATKWYKNASGITTKWFDGPEFLWHNKSTWPTGFQKQSNESMDLRSHLILHINTTKITFLTVTVNLSYTNSWNKLVRSQAYFERAVSNFKTRKTQKLIGPLLLHEIKNAEKSLFKRAQWDAFKDEVSLLHINPGSRVEPSSSIYSYSPYIDEEGLIRMKGRIDKTESISFQTKRPLILPKNHEITFKLVNHYHHKFLHQNHETIINEIRQCFVIPQVRVVYRKVRSQCQTCKVKLAKPKQPEMAELPSDRLVVNVRPFTNVGVDYFGPLEVVVGRRVEKRWGVLYTCMSVRAIHLEIVNSLSTE